METCLAERRVSAQPLKWGRVATLELLREKPGDAAGEEKSQGSVYSVLQATVRRLDFILSAAGSHGRVLRKKVACILDGNVPWTFGNINVADSAIYISVTWISHCPRNIKLLIFPDIKILTRFYQSQVCVI